MGFLMWPKKNLMIRYNEEQFEDLRCSRCAGNMMETMLVVCSNALDGCAYLT